MGRRSRAPRAPKPLPPVTVTPPPPPWPDPPWYRKDLRSRCYPHQGSLRQILEEEWWLPPFQREVVWTAEQQAAYCNSVLDGMPTAPLFVWERRIAGQRRNVVLDGQQRLTALGAKVFRSDGAPNPSSDVGFDIETGRFVPGGNGLTAAQACNYRLNGFLAAQPSPETEEHRRWFWHIHAYDLVCRPVLVVYTIEESASPAWVVEAFKTFNRPGVVFDQAEIERRVAVVGEW